MSGELHKRGSRLAYFGTSECQSGTETKLGISQLIILFIPDICGASLIQRGQIMIGKRKSKSRSKEMVFPSPTACLPTYHKISATACLKEDHCFYKLCQEVTHALQKREIINATAFPFGQASIVHSTCACVLFCVPSGIPALPEFRGRRGCVTR